MDTLQLFGMYERNGVDVEELLEQSLRYEARVENVSFAPIPALRTSIPCEEWKQPYKFVLCPQADAQGIRVLPDKNTFFIETFGASPSEVSARIAELYRQQ